MLTRLADRVPYVEHAFENSAFYHPAKDIGPNVKTAADRVPFVEHAFENSA